MAYLLLLLNENLINNPFKKYYSKIVQYINNINFTPFIIFFIFFLYPFSLLLQISFQIHSLLYILFWIHSIFHYSNCYSLFEITLHLILLSNYYFKYHSKCFNTVSKINHLYVLFNLFKYKPFLIKILIQLFHCSTHHIMCFH